MPKLDEDDLPIENNNPLPTPVMSKSSPPPTLGAQRPAFGSSPSFGGNPGGFGGGGGFSSGGFNNQNNNSGNYAQQGELSSTLKLDKKAEDWMNSKWRPMMGWTYMGTCIFDFMLAPVLWSLIQVIGAGKVEMQWQPLTLQGAGLYHVAMGAVLGIAAWSRGQEKMASKQ